MNRPKQFEKSAESEVWSAIAAFEEILAAMPDDRTALETLYDAYDHIGEKTKALEHLVKLASQVRDEQDPGPISWICESLERLGREDPQAKQASQDLEKMAESMGLPSPGQMVSSRSTAGATRGLDVSSELSLAWKLRQENQVTEAEYSQLVQDISENSTKHLNVPVSVLHVVHDRTFKELPRITAHLSRESGMPIVRLADFAVDARIFKNLDVRFAEQKGALLFDEMGGEYMVAVLNPYNETLREEVQGATSRICHFYLVEAEDYDAFLERSRVPEVAEARV